MFSDSSFNALLKTLEEPPPHVKFLLATTDPQKVPMTVLSRCLQFGLRRLDMEQIRGQLARILEAESVDFEPPALDLLARGADGSMRDALSLLDQAIAFGGGQVTDTDVRAMLGAVSRDSVLGLIEALAEQNGTRLIGGVAELAEASKDFGSVLAELLRLLHRIAVLQMVPDAPVEDLIEREAVAALAARLTPEDVQLFYEIGTQGQRSLAFSPDPRSGLEMILLRMLAFRPEAAETGEVTPTARNKGAVSSSGERTKSSQKTVQKPAPRQAAPKPESDSSNKEPKVDRAARLADWAELVDKLQLGGLASQLAAHSVLGGWEGDELTLLLDPANKSLQTAMATERLQKALAEHLGQDVKLRIEVSEPASETPAQQQARRNEQRQQEAEQHLTDDPLVRALGEKLGGRLVPESIAPQGKN